MTTKEFKIAENTRRIAGLLAEKMPHLDFAIWDLSEFMHTFHNVRRNMIFIECEEVARKEVISKLADEPKLRGYIVYSGGRKPKAINEEWASARSTEEIRSVIVVLSRKDFAETMKLGESIRVPSIERRLVDLMAYALKGYLPIGFDEAIDATIWYLKRGELRMTALQRYATRKYLGWFVDILIFKLEEKGVVSAASVDPRYLENGRRYFEAIKRVDEI